MPTREHGPSSVEYWSGARWHHASRSACCHVRLARLICLMTWPPARPMHADRDLAWLPCWQACRTVRSSYPWPQPSTMLHANGTNRSGASDQACACLRRSISAPSEPCHQSRSPRTTPRAVQP
eukprot:354674-Chlamydomonas_euryale.AAC.5